MTPLPPPLGNGALVMWRLDQARFAPQWDSGEGAYLAGGRWSSRGVRAVYAALDPATAILEVAVDAIITIDRRGHIGVFNKAAQEMFGYRPEEVVGKNIAMLMPPST